MYLKKEKKKMQKKDHKTIMKITKKSSQERKARYQAQRTHSGGENEMRFVNRTSRKRALDRIKAALPVTPCKWVAVIASLVRSPSTRNELRKIGLCTTSEEEEMVAISEAALADASVALEATKRRRSNDSRRVTSTTLASI